MTMAPWRIQNAGPFSAARGGTQSLSLTSNVAWPSANLALYCPIVVPDSFPVASIFIGNGSNLTGTIDLGIYSWAGSLLASLGGSAVRSVASTLEFHALSHTLARGWYYLGAVTSAGAGTYEEWIGVTVSLTRVLGILQEPLGGVTLPATMTPVAVGQTFMPVIGISQQATV